MLSAVNSVNASGACTAGLSCGSGCGVTFAIQVAPDRVSFNLVDVTDPGQFIAGRISGALGMQREDQCGRLADAKKEPAIVMA